MENKNHEIVNKELENKYADKLKKVYEKYLNDNEMLHIECDYILIQFLNELGYTKIIEEYEKIEDNFWYA